MADRTSPLAAWPALALHRGASYALAIVVIAMFIAWPWTGWSTTYGAWAGAPDPFVLLLLAAYLAAATFVHGRRRWLGKLLAAAALVWIWSSYRVLTMGDGHWWRNAAVTGTVTWAEPLSSHLQILLHRIGGPNALEWWPPAVGAFATWAWLTACDRLLGERSTRAQRLAAALLWSSSGLLCAFFHRYVEHTQVGVPLLVLGLAQLTAWSRTVATAPAPTVVGARGFYIGTALLAFATALHVMYVGMFVTATGAALLVAMRARLRFVRPVLGLAAGTAAAIGALVVLFVCGPFTPFYGSIAGGGDHRLLTPLHELLSARHLALVTFLLAFGTPMVLPLAVATVVRPRAVWLRTEPVAAAAAVAYLLFVASYGFDLGWPRDADLMLAMGAAVTWFVTTWLLPHAGTGSLVLLALATVSTWSVIMPIVRPIGANISQANSAIASLHIDGFPEPAARGPFDVPVAIGQTLTLRASGPPGAEFWIMRGAPAPACEGHPYGSVADIEQGDSLDASSFVHTGHFDASGTARIPYVVQPLPDGRLPGLQMVVFHPSSLAASTASAAFYMREK